ncbi:BUD32 family EKC/KEOPS complex subunit [Frigoriglobus tundricola]|uniref:Protein kinase domain-containing protein n=1 Tax=Frigoriglobus tundricola TaxID=2774151 RepID=A0A6M5YIW4_9BACT|nr:hypothetical protein [Frigoriglobus tundricola]QJW93271.1 hypothetical protein FTUN_0777 [Frigoriglobus tundricola]
MSWPLSHEFNEAVQHPRTAFADPDLQSTEAVVGATGLPLPRSGNFADVYQMRGADKRDWAVKCFTRPVVGLAERYARVSEALAAANFPFTVGFRFLAEGIRVGGQWRPVVTMEWVEGLLLNQVVRENAARPAVLAALGLMWVKLCKRLRETGVAHADLQHGNVLLVPGSRPGAYGLKLIDYDGMYVPALANTPSGEAGHPSFQHPARTATRAYSPDVDRFPHLVILTALQGLVTGGSALWERHDNGDNLLFTEADFRAPHESKLLRELWLTGDPAVQSLVGRLAIACGKPMPQTPWVDELAPEGKPAPLDNDTYRAAAAALGLARPVPIPLPPEPTAPPLELPDHFENLEVAPAPSPEKPPVPPSGSGPLVQAAKSSPKMKGLSKSGSGEKPVPAAVRRAEPERTPRTRTDESERGRNIAGWQIVVAAGVMLVAIAGAVLALRNKPVETAERKPDEEPVNAQTPTPPPVPTAPKEQATRPPDPKPKEPDRTGPKVKTPDPPPKPKDVPPPPVVPEPAVLKPRWTATAGTDGARAALCADAHTVMVGSARSTLITLDLATGTKRPQSAWYGLTGGDNFCTLDDGRVARCTPDETELPTWEVKTWKTTEKIRVPAIPAGSGTAKHAMARPSPDGRFLLVARTASAPGVSPPVPLRVFDTRSEKAVVETDWTCGSAHYTADSLRVLVAEHGGKFRWFQLPAGEPDGDWNYGPPPAGRAHAVTSVNANGRVIGYNGPAKFDADSGPCFIDGKSGTVLHRFGPPYSSRSPVVLSADGRAAAVLKEPVGAEVTIDVVGVPKGEVIARATVPTSGGSPTIFLTGDSRVLLAHDPKTGTLWRFDLP